MSISIDDNALTILVHIYVKYLFVFKCLLAAYCYLYLDGVFGKSNFT